MVSDHGLRNSSMVGSATLKAAALDLKHCMHLAKQEGRLGCWHEMLLLIGGARYCMYQLNSDETLSVKLNSTGVVCHRPAAQVEVDVTFYRKSAPELKVAKQVRAHFLASCSSLCSGWPC